MMRWFLTVTAKMIWLCQPAFASAVCLVSDNLREETWCGGSGPVCLEEVCSWINCQTRKWRWRRPVVGKLTLNPLETAPTFVNFYCFFVVWLMTNALISCFNLGNVLHYFRSLHVFIDFSFLGWCTEFNWMSSPTTIYFFKSPLLQFL